jgi:hypothetical protein
MRMDMFNNSTMGPTHNLKFAAGVDIFLSFKIGSEFQHNKH